MTVFHDYQWDLNYTNPRVFIEMLDTIFFYANLGVDVLRIDAPAFIWKQLGTTCQNLPQAHVILRLIKQCVQVATPGMALLGEATFGHMIPKYAVHLVDSDMLNQCIKKSLEKVSLAILDWKGIKSEDKPNLLSVLETVGLPFKKV
jgi:hypothetical protein